MNLKDSKQIKQIKQQCGFCLIKIACYKKYFINGGLSADDWHGVFLKRFMFLLWVQNLIKSDTCNCSHIGNGSAYTNYILSHKKVSLEAGYIYLVLTP